MSRPTPSVRTEYPHFIGVQTRWSDNDVYGHVNNAVYYHYFDTVVNSWLVENDLLVIGKSEVIGLVVNTSCDYFAPISYPQDVQAGLRVARIGSSSVTYEISLFTDGSDDAAAQGTFTHVYVDADSRKATPISDEMRAKLAHLEA